MFSNTLILCVSDMQDSLKLGARGRGILGSVLEQPWDTKLVILDPSSPTELRHFSVRPPG